MVRRRVILLLLPALGLVAAPARARDEGCEIEAVSRVVAVGDVHGAYPELRTVLAMAGIIDARDHWSGGTTHLVQLGDVLDRGSETRPALELLMRLEGEARKAGGRVHALLGNHEVMNLLGDLRYLNRDEYKAFQTPDSQHSLRRLYRQREEAARQQAKDAKQPFDEAAFSARFEQQFPPGFVERYEAFSAQGRYGEWLRQHRVMVKIGGVAFLHGGLSPEVAALGCETINATVRREITTDFEKTQANPLASLAGSESGPLWYRGLAREDETAWLPTLEKVLASIGARRIVVGHSVTSSGRIEARFGGRVVTIDVGMNPLYGRHLAALEIAKDGAIFALSEGGREELAALPKAATLAH